MTRTSDINHAISIEDIRAAAACLKGHVVRTPFLPAPRLSALTGAEIHIKYENMQVTGAFKERGAFVKLSRLGEAAKAKGVIAMSAGNHAQAVACHAQKLGIPATIVMPVGTPFVKVENTARFGARVILEGATLAESQTTVEKIIAEEGLTLVHPYDDADVMAGQGTIALEMLEDNPDLDMIVIPMGGGGLIAGNAVAIRALAPQVKVIGVEVESYPSFHNALTGESLPESKDTAPIAEEADLGDRANMVFSGTAATYGRGRAVVVATGMQTEMGRIAVMLKETREESTPLQKELARVGKTLGLAVIVIAAVMIVTTILAEHVTGLSGIFDVFIFGVALAVAAVPEGLPLVATLAQLAAARRLSGEHVLIRNANSVEALARQAAVDLGAVECVMFRDGLLTEGSASNVWVVRDGRVLAHELLERVEREHLRGRVVEREHRRGARGAGAHERELADHASGADDVEGHVVVGLRRDADREPAGLDDVEPVAGVALAEEHVTAAEAQGLAGVEHLGALGFRHRREQGDVHGRIPSLRGRRPQPLRLRRSAARRDRPARRPG